MSGSNPVALLCFLSTIAAAMVLRIMTLLPGMDELSPDWIILVLMYWSIALPERFGVFTAFWVGLVTDVLTGHLLGQYALIYALVCYLSIRQYRRLRQLPLPQQCLHVLFCLLCGQSLLFGMESMQAPNRLPLSFWYPVLTGMLAWPLVFLILRKIRLFTRISG